MHGKTKQFSLNRRIMTMNLIPLIFLLSVLFIYLSVYQTNVESMAETTFRSLVDLKEQQAEKKLDKIRSITKELAYSSILQQYLTESDNSQKVQTYKHFQNYLRAVISSSDAVVSAYAGLGTQSSVHMADGYLYIFEAMQKRLDLQALADKNTEYFTDWRTAASGLSPYGMCFYIGSPIHVGSIYKNDHIVGGLIYDPSKLLEADDNMPGQIAVLVLKNKAVYISGQLRPEQLRSLLDAPQERLTLDGTDYFCSRKPISGMQDMTLLYLVPKETLLPNQVMWEEQTLAFIALAVVLMALSVTLILRSIFRPIKQMCKEVEALKNYDEKLSTPKEMELAALTDTYNAMSQRISESIQQEKQMVDQQYQLQIQKNRMEMQAFRNQINPHFLFNTLECLNGMVRYYQLEPVSDLITNLSGCFHYSLYSPMMVTLAEELAHLTNYLDIIETRFPGKYRIIYQIDEEAKAVLVPSLLLQPLAENAVTHAFKGYAKKARPTIVLQARLDGDKKQLHIHVIDNGIGMDEEKLAEVLETMHTKEYVDKHISLNNVYRRLTLLYGREYLQVSARRGCYTRISVRIPLNQRPPQLDDTHSA